MGGATARGVIAATVIGSGMALLDGTVVNIALRTIGEELDTSLAQLQWITNGYLLSLASLILLGGSLGDRFGRRRVFVLGTVWFALASALCGLAPSPEVLIAARLLQGVGAALLTPGSLAILETTFRVEDRAPAIGAWSALGSIAAAIGPFVGGLLVDQASWRWIFWINLPLAVLTVVLAHRYVPESRDPSPPGRFDLAGAGLVTLALAGLTYGLIEWGSAVAVVAGLVGVGALGAFVLVERRVREPLLPLGVFASRTFSAANAMTLVVYAALGAVLFFLVIELQTVAGYSAFTAGIATLPITLCMLLLATAGGRLGARIGPRVPMTFGPLVMASGSLLLLRVGPDSAGVRGYLVDVVPGLLVFGLGLALMVATLTATVLAAAPQEHAGVASGVNNALARAGSLLAIAALPVAVGLTGEEYADPASFDAGFTRAIVICACLLAVGAAVSWTMIRPDVLQRPVDEGAPAGP
jgi:EmrB/QacA subfamily drug resistance transporter